LLAGGDESTETVGRNVNPIPKVVVEDSQKVEELREKVEEVKDLVQTNVNAQLEKRLSALQQLEEQTSKMETFAHSFAEVSSMESARKKAMPLVLCIRIVINGEQTIAFYFKNDFYSKNVRRSSKSYPRSFLALNV